ncbi:MAG: VWA domain-containing protein [Myxococcales bacterium]|nr:VWA domain-containing protein [Myxococcota bacterium]MDW8280128.1 VWA domain-containing protein [Myxococcales bacterium]
MTLAGLPWAQLLGLFAAGAAALTMLYLLRQRRRRLEVPFLRLWEQVLRQSEATTLWQRMQRWLSLLVQLLILSLLVLALGDPRLGASPRGRTLVLLIDASASMQAKGGDGRSRFDLAVEQARHLVRHLAGDDTAVVVALDSQPAPMGGLSQNERELLQQLDAVRVQDGPADLLRGLQLAQDLSAGRPNPQVVLFSDGGFDEATLAAVPAGLDLRFQPLPDGAARMAAAEGNLAITSFAVRRYRRNRLGYEVLVELAAFGPSGGSDGPSVPVELEIRQEGETVDLQQLTLRPGERLRRLYPNLGGSGTRLEARLRRRSGGDLLPLDDTAYALMPQRRRQRLLLVSRGNLFLEGALLSISAGEENQIEIEKVAPAAYDPLQAARFDIVLFDAFTPPEPPAAHALYLDPQGPGSPLPIVETVVAPLVTDVAKEHPVLRWVTLKDLNISRASVFRLGPNDVALASMLRRPILAALERQQGGKVRRAVLVGFDIRRSDLPLRVAFPLLLVNALDWLAGEVTDEALRFTTGQTWRIPLADRAAAPTGEADLVLPDGGRVPVPVHEGVALYHGQRVGFYELQSRGQRPVLLSANLFNPVESTVRLRTELAVGEGAARRVLPQPEMGRRAVRRALWPYLLLLCLLLLFLEWWSYQRRWTV